MRTVFGGLTCPTALAVDPLSGDLFFDDSCFGAGSDNPSLFRLRNPGSASPTLEVYATLPTTPTGWIAIAPDGTIYMPQTLTPPAPVVRISGTDKPSPATVTPVPGLTTNYWVTVGETLPNGSAKSLIVLNGSTIQLADITTNPPTFTDLINTGPGSGKIGPDGCLYVTNLDTIYKLAPSAGGCGFAVSSPAPVLTLSPATASPAQGTTLTFTAQFVNLSVPAGTPVVFSSYGANAQQRSGNTDASGKATISYLGTATGTDTVVAKATVGTRSYESNQARIEWSGGKHTLFLSLNESAGGGTVGLPVMLSGTLYDISVTPRAPVPGATVQFSASGLTCSGVTDAAGRASCTVTPVTPGLTTQVASYGGSASFLSTSATQQFTVMAATASVAPLPVSLDFGSQAIGTTSATRSTVLTNAGTLAFTLSTIALAGSNAADFALGSGPNACAIGGTLAANGASCTLYLSFTPGATGSRGATVTVTDNAAASSVGVGLSGNGAGPTNNCFTGSLPVGGSGTACVTGVLPACQFSSAAFVPVTSVGTPLPSGVTVPFGLFQFVATGCGASLSLTITYPAPLPSNATYYKYGSELAQPSPHWYSLPATVNGNAMTVTLVDGGAGDSDLAANGTIVDPGGAGYVTAPPPIITPVPTLDRWTLLLLALLVAGTAFTRAARRR